MEVCRHGFCSRIMAFKMTNNFRTGSPISRFCGNYGDLAGSPVIGCLVNSDGLMELALYGASLQQRHNLEIGDPVRVRLK